MLTLLEAQGRQLHALLTRLTLREQVAEDLLQDLFVKLRQSEGFTQAADPAAFAFRSAINLAMNWRRSQSRRRETPGLPDDMVSLAAPPWAELFRIERAEQLLHWLGQLPALEQEIVVLRYLQQESYEAVGQRVGKTAHQARAICHKAIGHLRELAGPGGPDKEVTHVTSR